MPLQVTAALVVLSLKMVVQVRIRAAEVPVGCAGLPRGEPRGFAFALGAGAACASVLLFSLARPWAAV